MQVDSADRALRAIVADLAVLEDEDADAILAELDPVGRARLASLLRAYRDGVVPDVVAGAPSMGDWLHRRLSATGSSAPTPRTRETLIRLHAGTAPPAPRPAPTSSPAGLFGLFKGAR